MVRQEDLKKYEQVKTPSVEVKEERLGMKRSKTSLVTSEIVEDDSDE